MRSDQTTELILSKGDVEENSRNLSSNSLERTQVGLEKLEFVEYLCT